MMPAGDGKLREPNPTRCPGGSKYAYKFNHFIIIRTHKKLDNDALNVYDALVASGPEPGGREQERIP